jgi:molecular chaperone GrpE
MSKKRLDKKKAACVAEQQVADAILQGLADEVKTLKEQENKLQDRILRLKAEFDNFRRRTQKEQQTGRQRGQNLAVQKLLPVLDDLERVMSQEAAEVEALQKGVQLAVDRFQKELNVMGVEIFVSKGEMFDHNLHDALTTASLPDVEDDQIVDEHLKGYRCGKEILRHARVIVNKRPADV